MSETTKKVFAETRKGKKYTDQELALFALGLTEEEVAEVLESDKKIDKGEKLFELSAEGKQAEKKYKNCGVRTVKSPYGQKVQKEKKVDTDKRTIMDILTEAIEENCGKTEIVNEEREFTFVYNDRKFKITLSAPRK